jgi:cytochrome P450
VPAAIAGGSAGEVFGALVRMNEGERHTAPRLVLQRALAGAASGEVAQQRARTIAAGLLAAGHPIGDWAFEAPVSTVAGLLGFADNQLPAVARWMGDFVACLSPLSSAAQIEQAHAASLRLLGAMRELLHAAPEGSLAAAVAQEAAAAGWQNDHAILANLVGLLSQTYEATAGLLGNSLVAIQNGAAGEDAGALVAQIMETDPPVINTRRFAAERCVVGGVTVEAGQAILVMLGAAKRGFGHGRHACPGQQLAQQIAAGCIEALRSKPLPQLTWTYRASLNARIPEFHQ